MVVEVGSTVSSLIDPFVNRPNGRYADPLDLRQRVQWQSVIESGALRARNVMLLHAQLPLRAGESKVKDLEVDIVTLSDPLDASESSVVCELSWSYALRSTYAVKTLLYRFLVVWKKVSVSQRQCSKRRSFPVGEQRYRPRSVDHDVSATDCVQISAMAYEKT